MFREKWLEQCMGCKILGFFPITFCFSDADAGYTVVFIL